MGSNCWMDGRSVGKSVENILQCDWLTRFMQIILLVSHWSESVLLMQGWRQCPSVHYYTAWSTVQVYTNWYRGWNQ
jgi:hypothetical protein